MMMKLITIQIHLMLMISMMMLMIQSFPTNNINTHPLMLMIMLFMLLIISSFNMSLFMNNHWFSFLMFLIIIGGMMIIFMYFVSFINNMKTSIKFSFLKNFPIKMLLLMMMFYLMFNHMDLNIWNINFNEIMSIKKNMFNKMNKMTLLYLYPKNLTTIISMMYLLICMTLIVKMCFIKKMTLRKIN